MRGTGFGPAGVTGGLIIGLFAVAREVNDDEGAFRVAEPDDEEEVGVGIGMDWLHRFWLGLPLPRGLLSGSTLIGFGRGCCLGFRPLFVVDGRLREMTRMISQSESGR
jgi:hypothetical protein